DAAGCRARWSARRSGVASGRGSVRDGDCCSAVIRERSQPGDSRGPGVLDLGARRPRDCAGDVSVLDQPARVGRQLGQPHHEDDGGSRMITKRENGQAMELMILFLAGLLGMAALVLDVESWSREKRQLQ